MFKDLVNKNRSYRRFNQSSPISLETLRDLIDLARITASGRNLQPLKYYCVSDTETCARIFPNLGLAGYLKDWPGPMEGERPAAYIVVLGDTSLAPSFGIDPGIAMQTMLLGAVEKGLGGCIIATVKKEEVRSILNLPDQYEILYVLALGEPLEQVTIEPMGTDGDVKYWRDGQQGHHVPKRSLKEIVIGEK